MDDQALLKRFAEGGAEGAAAFRQVVERHQDWVYSVCRRAIRDSNLAEDAAQGVFLALARKVREIAARDGAIEGWLYDAARFASANLRRSRTRQARHEKEAGAMRNALTQKTAWAAMEGEIEPAMERLGREDRNAILLRFYRGMSHAEVAAAMGISEEAAKKRVGRAVGKLREILTRRGVPEPIAGIGGAGAGEAGVAGLLATEAVRPAPTDFTAKVMSGASGGAASMSALSVMKKLLRRRLVMGLKIGSIAALLAIAVGAVMVMGKEGEKNVGETATTAPAETSTPLAALKMFNHAMRTANVKELAAVMDARTPEGQAMLADMEKVMTAVGELRTELVVKFGAEAAATAHELEMGAVPEEMLENSLVQVDGEKATVDVMAGKKHGSFDLVLVDGKWKIDVGNLLSLPKQNPKGRKQFSDQMMIQLGKITSLKKDLDDGKLTTIDDVNERLGMKKGK